MPRELGEKTFPSLVWHGRGDQGKVEGIKSQTGIQVRNNSTKLGCDKEGKVSGLGSQDNRRKRNKRFEDALLKWQEYGNDIIERKRPNYLVHNEKTQKAMRNQIDGKVCGEHQVTQSDEKIGSSNLEHREIVERLVGRLTEDRKDFQDMKERSAKIERHLRELKQRSSEVLF